MKRSLPMLSMCDIRLSLSSYETPVGLSVTDVTVGNAVVTCKIKLYQNYFSLRRRPSKIVLPEIISKLFQRLIASFENFPTCSMLLK